MRIRKQEDEKSAPVFLSSDSRQFSPKLIEERDALETRIKESLKRPVLDSYLIYSKDQLLLGDDARWHKQGIYAFIACDNLEEIVYIGRAREFKGRLLPQHCRQTLGHNIFRRAKKIYGDIVVYAFEVTDNYEKIELDLIDEFSPVLNTVGKLQAKTFEVLQYIINNPGCTRHDVTCATTIGDQKRKDIVEKLIESGKILMIEGVSKVGRPAYYHFPHGAGLRTTLRVGHTGAAPPRG